jgi:hypothetical protein
MLAFALAALIGLFITVLLQSSGAFGSCFEGSCGYAGLFWFPLVTLVAFFSTKKYVGRLGKLSTLLVSALAFMTAALLFVGFWGSMLVLVVTGVLAARMCFDAKSRGEGLQSLLLRSSTR